MGQPRSARPGPARLGRPRGAVPGLRERLAARGYQLIALDAPAHGRSPGAEADPVVFADALQEVAAELGPLHAVVGHSMGGASALYALSRGLDSGRSVAIAAPAGLAGVLARMSQAPGPARGSPAPLLRQDGVAHGPGSGSAGHRPPGSRPGPAPACGARPRRCRDPLRRCPAHHPRDAGRVARDPWTGPSRGAARRAGARPDRRIPRGARGLRFPRPQRRAACVYLSSARRFPCRVLAD
ncbi:alpha/beta fold hydrolase [Arenimonas daejeonensis]|uniref:alpha/beta hydrolase n=1 Tax=Arenimonas daejeonensis TaxID=370777 RepID=UPI0011BDBB46